MGQYSIKDLEQLSGIKAHTIRIWEQRYSLIEPKRTDTNIRYYDDEQLKYLLNVSLLSKNGCKISKISKWSEEEFLNQVKRIYEQSLIHDGRVQLDLDANDLITAMIDMDALKFHRIYENSIRNNGFQKTITELIYPFLEKVGILWTIGQINPAQEHFVSSLIRQKIISAIDKLEENQSGDKFLLFLPECEHHEIGLLLSHYLLKKSGKRVYYLGQNLPMSDVSSAVLTIDPDFILTFMIDPAILNNAHRITEQLQKFRGNSSVLIATRQSAEIDSLSMEGVSFLHGMSDLDRFL
jgi:DNA-binding transcriptional MerR regulator